MRVLIMGILLALGVFECSFALKLDAIINKMFDSQDKAIAGKEATQGTKLSKAEFLIINKREGVSQNKIVKVGSKEVMDSLLIATEKCVTKGGGDDYAYISVLYDGNDVFEGWISSRNIGAKSVEHSMFDVILKGCS